MPHPFFIVRLLIIAAGISYCMGTAHAAIQDAKLLPTVEGFGGVDDNMGYSVSVDGDLALVGAPFTNDNGLFGNGAVYVYAFHAGSNRWVLEDRLLAIDGTSYDQFGISVSLSGDRALVGARGDNVSGTQTGSAYLFERDARGNSSPMTGGPATDLVAR